MGCLRVLVMVVATVVLVDEGLDVACHEVVTSFAAAAVLISRVRTRATPPPAHPARATGPVRPTTLPRPARGRADGWAARGWADGWAGRGWADGWAEIRRVPLLGRLLGVVVLTGIGEGCVSALLAPYTAEVFGSSTASGAAPHLPGPRRPDRSARHQPTPDHRPTPPDPGRGRHRLRSPAGRDDRLPAALPAAVAGAAPHRRRRPPLRRRRHRPDDTAPDPPRPALRGRVYGVTAAAAGAAQLIGILVSGYAADRTNVYVLLTDAPCYLIAGLLVLRRPRHDPAPTDTHR